VAGEQGTAEGGLRGAARDLRRARRYGVIEGASRPARARADVGRGYDEATGPSHKLTDEEVNDFAGAAAAMLETQGRPVEATLSAMRAEAGGFLPPWDVERVRERVCALLADAGR
jgi:hypothetical protein